MLIRSVRMFDAIPYLEQHRVLSNVGRKYTDKEQIEVV